MKFGHLWFTLPSIRFKGNDWRLSLTTRWQRYYKAGFARDFEGGQLERNSRLYFGCFLLTVVYVPERCWFCRRKDAVTRSAINDQPICTRCFKAKHDMPYGQYLYFLWDSSMREAYQVVISCIYDGDVQRQTAYTANWADYIRVYEQTVKQLKSTVPPETRLQEYIYRE
jgi:hypothetical protein